MLACLGCNARVPKEAIGDGSTEEDRLKRMDLTARSLVLNGGRMIVYGILGRANSRNRNGRVYSKELLQREAGVFYNAHVRMHRALGELDHPPPSSPTFRSLNLNNVSHQVLDYHWKGDDLMGFVEVLPTQAGSMLRDLYCAGFQLGMSSRGWATLKERDGFIYIQDDFELITFDFVSDPSTEGAYLRPVQRKYEQLRPPIDINATYRSFMNFNQTAAAIAKREAAAAAMLQPGTRGMVHGGHGYGHSHGAAPPFPPTRSATLVACEDSRVKGREGERRVGVAGSGSSMFTGAPRVLEPTLPQTGGEGGGAAVRASGDAATDNGRSRVGGRSRGAGGAGGGRETGSTRGTPSSVPVPLRLERSVQDGMGKTNNTVSSMFFGPKAGASKVLRSNKVIPGPPANVSLRENWIQLQQQSGLAVG